MAGNAFEFGIGITASDEGASQAIGGVISQISTIDDRMGALSSGGSFSEIMGMTGAAGDANRLRAEICGVVICAENADDAIRAAADSTGQLADGMSRVPPRAATTAEHMGRVGEAANLLTASGSQLRHEMTRTYRGMGDTALSADMMAASVLDLATETKTSWQEVAQLQQRLAGAAIGMDDLQGSAHENMTTMVMLHESFAMSNDDVQRLAGSMKVTGMSLTELSGVAVQFQKDFRVPGLINTLPAAAEAAIEAQSQFGSTVGTSSRAITTNIMRMTGVYSRALGVTAAEAANKARSTFMKFTGEVESFEDLFLGLADDFTPLQTAFLETGISMEDMEDLMRKGATAPEEFAEEVKRIRDSMDPQMGQRFFRQVLRNTDEATRQLLTQEEAARNANEAAAGAGVEPEDPSATFNAIADSMRENAVDAERMRVALVGAREETARLAGDEGLRQGTELLNTVLQAENELLIGTYRSLRNNRVAYAMTNKVIGAGTFAILGMNDALLQFNQITGIGSTVWLGLVGGISLALKPFKWLWRGITKLKTPFQWLWNKVVGLGGHLRSLGSTIRTGLGRALSWLGRAFGGIGGRLRSFGSVLRSVGIRGAMRGLIQGARIGIRVLGKLAAPVWLAYNAFVAFKKRFENIGEILSSSEGWGPKVKKIFKELVGGIWDTFSGFFFGLPDYFIKGFRNVGAKFSTEGAKDMGKSVGKILAAFGKGVVNFFKDSYNWLTGPFKDGVKNAFATVKEFLLTTVPTVFTESIIPGFKAGIDRVGLFFTEDIPAFIGSVIDWIAGIQWVDDVFMPIVSGFAAMGDQILAFLGGVMEGMLEAFGMTSDDAASTVDALGTIIKVTFQEAFAWAARIFEESGDYFMLYVISPLQKGMSHVKEVVGTAVEIIRSAFKVAFAGIELVVMGVLNKVVGGIASMALATLGTLQSMIDGLNTGLSALGLDEISVSFTGVSDTIRGYRDDLDDAESAARRRASGEVEAAAERIMAIRSASAAERTAMDETDARRRASMQANSEAFDTARQERAQVLGQAVDVLMGADPNAEANAARDQRNAEEAERLRGIRLAGYQEEVAAVNARNAALQQAADQRFEARQETARTGLQAATDHTGRRVHSDQQVESMVGAMRRQPDELAPTPEPLPTMPLGAQPQLPMVGPGAVADRARPAQPGEPGFVGPMAAPAGGFPPMSANFTIAPGVNGALGGLLDYFNLQLAPQDGQGPGQH